MYDERFLEVAHRILDGDDSIDAANELEGVVLNDYPGDDRFDELGEALALYAPGQGLPYSDAETLRLCIRSAIASLG